LYQFYMYFLTFIKIFIYVFQHSVIIDVQNMRFPLEFIMNEGFDVFIKLIAQHPCIKIRFLKISGVLIIV
jgi:hypothetical protein